MFLAITIIVFLFVFLLVSIFYIIKFGTIIIRVQDTIEESLDVLDEEYESMNNVLQTPLFFDSPEIRKVLSSIRKTRESILQIAKALTSIEDVEMDQLDDDVIEIPKIGNE